MYSGDMTWAYWVQSLENQHNLLLQALHQCEDSANKWYDYAYGKTDADIATALSKAVGDITAMQTAANAMLELVNVMRGEATVPTAKDYLGLLRKF